MTLLDPHNVVMVSGGNRHSAVVSLEGKVLTFGSSELTLLEDVYSSITLHILVY